VNAEKMWPNSARLVAVYDSQAHHPTFWDAIVFKQSSAIKTGHVTKHLRVDRLGNTLALYVNGQKLLETRHADVKSGQVGPGVTMQPNSAAMDVRFDNFVVRAAKS
jgi:hypothetical protein